MTIFHEMYGAYFRIAAKVLGQPEISEQALRQIVQQEGFRDSVLFVPQRLIPQPDGSDWGLLRRTDSGMLRRITQHAPQMPLTLLQKRWLKAKLSEPVMQLFLSDETSAALNDALRDIKPLYTPEMFRTVDAFSDCDDFSDPLYRAHFRQIVQAIRNGEVLLIRFRSGGGERIHTRFLPFALEYSAKNGKFRLYCRRFRAGHLTGTGLINLGRIEKITLTGIRMSQQHSPAELFAARKCTEPVTIRVTPARNGVERFMMEFASYEKHSELDTETGCCTVQLWYDRQDETELLIQLLSFGPVLEILGPPAFRAKAAERVAKQYALLFGQPDTEI